jgi:iron complex outermembrane receptor protein
VVYLGSGIGRQIGSRRVAALALILLGTAAAPSPAQRGVLRGHVVRADRPIGLAGADLELRPSGSRTRTDARGFFAFGGLAAGTVDVVVRRVGFTPAVVTVEVDTLTATQIDIPLDPAPIMLDPIVTSATRDERSLSQVAAAVSVADTSSIQRDRTIGLHEVLGTMPGVQAASRYGTEDARIGIRGSASRGGVAPRGVAVLLDGIPLTEPDGVARLDFIELAASRQVEVVRGPVSALYLGSPSGVVNVVSRSGRDSRGLSVRALRGAFGFQKYDGNAGGMFADGRGSAFASASYTAADGYRAHSDGDILRGQVAFDYVPGPGTRVVIEANGSRLDSRLPGSQTQPEFDADPDAAAPAAVAFGFGRGDNRFRGGARVEQAVGRGIAGAYFFYGGRTLDFPIATQIVDLNLHRVQVGGRLRVARGAGSALAATIGIDYDNIFSPDRRWVNDSSVRDTLRAAGTFSVPNLGAYSQVEWQAGRTVGLAIGLRYDRVMYGFETSLPAGVPRQEKTFDHFSPRLSVLWNRDSTTSLYATVGRGVEVPALGELSAGPGSALLSVYPKSLWNYEVGGRRTVGDRVLLEGSVFYADVWGEFVPRTVNNTSSPENASRSRNIGIELGVRARASPQVDLAATYAFLDPRLKDYTSAVLDSTGTLQQADFAGKVLPAVPRHRLTGEARLNLWPALDIGLRVEWQDVMYVETSNADAGVWYFQRAPGAPVQQVPFRAVPARALLHLNAAFRLGGATLFGTVENLFGHRYAGTLQANESTGRFYEAGPPASASVGFRLTGWAPAQPAVPSP